MFQSSVREQTGISVAACGYRRVLDIISNKWTALVIYALEDGSLRYGAVKRRIEGVSQKMLTQTLRQLERDGLVKRDVTPSIPPSVNYSLTELGESLLPALWQLKEWTTAHYPQVMQARDEYDQSADSQSIGSV